MSQSYLFPRGNLQLVANTQIVDCGGNGEFYSIYAVLQTLCPNSWAETQV